MSRKKPPHLRVLEGNPGKRSIKKKGVQPKGEAVAPAWLSVYALEAWNRVVAAMPPGTYRATDEGILAAWCSACADLEEASWRLAIEGAVIVGPRGAQRKNPWLAVRKDAVAAIERLGKRLGLDPTARHDLPPPPPPPGTSKFGGLTGLNPTKHGDQDDDG